ncbi:MAG: hypothetical protein AAGG81_07995 [Chlamydiota bacterium]
MDPSTNESRTYLYKDFPESEYCSGCDEMCGPKGLVKSWEHEKYAWQDNKIADCCGYGALYRCQVTAGTAIALPADLCLMITGIGCTALCGTCATVRSVVTIACCPLSCCCKEFYGEMVDSTIGTWKTTFAGLKCSGATGLKAAEDLLCCFPNVIAEELLNAYCGQPERMLKNKIATEEVIREYRTMNE